MRRFGSQRIVFYKVDRRREETVGFDAAADALATLFDVQVIEEPS